MVNLHAVTKPDGGTTGCSALAPLFAPPPPRRLLTPSGSDSLSEVPAADADEASAAAASEAVVSEAALDDDAA